MKRIFGRWLIFDWQTMSSQEKLRFKRLCLMPLLAYAAYIFLRLYTPVLVLVGVGYFAYKKYEQGRLKK